MSLKLTEMWSDKGLDLDLDSEEVTAVWIQMIQLILFSNVKEKS